MKAVKNSYLVFLFIVLIFNTNCNSHKPDEPDALIGTWTALNNASGLTHTFTKDTVYIKVNSFEYSCFYRRIESDDDSLFMYFPDDDIPIKYTYKLSNGKLLLVSYKHTGTISQVILFAKSEAISKKEKAKNEKIEFIIENDFIGNVCVNFQGKIKNSERQTIHVPETGFAETEFKEKPLSIYSGKLSFVKNNDLENKIPFFHYSAIDKQSVERLYNEYNKDSIFVGLYGFNRIGREEVNKRFGKEIKGNVFMFRVDTLKNLLEKHQGFFTLK